MTGRPQEAHPSRLRRASHWLSLHFQQSRTGLLIVRLATDDGWHREMPLKEAGEWLKGHGYRFLHGSNGIWIR